MPSRWAASAVLSQVISVVPIKWQAYRTPSASLDEFGGPSPRRHAFSPEGLQRTLSPGPRTAVAARPEPCQTPLDKGFSRALRRQPTLVPVPHVTLSGVDGRPSFRLGTPPGRGELLPVTRNPDLVGTRTDPDGNGRRAAPTITRRSSLPSGRAVVGGLLVTLAVLGTYFAATAGDSGPDTQYVVAARAIDQGERLSEGDLRMVAMDLSAGVADHAFRETDALRGAVALAPLREGSLIEASQVLPPSVAAEEPLEPTHELSLRLPVEQAVDGALNRGERVDVLATYGTGDEAITVVVTRDALVTAIGHPDDAGL